MRRRRYRSVAPTVHREIVPVPEGHQPRCFHSVSEYISEIENRPDLSSSATDFAGCSFPQAIHMAKYGWPEGTSQAAKVSQGLVNRIMQSYSMGLSTESVQDVTGAVYDPASYISGVPECWLRPDMQPSRRAVSIGVNISASSAISNETITARGTATMALVLLLQSQGYPVTVDLIAGNAVAKACNYYARLCDAETGSQLDIDRLSFLLSHPSSLRHITRAHYNLMGYSSTEWGTDMPSGDWRPMEYDLFLGGTNLMDVKRWEDGGEKWILDEFNRQTEAA